MLNREADGVNQTMVQYFEFLYYRESNSTRFDGSLKLYPVLQLGVSLTAFPNLRFYHVNTLSNVGAACLDLTFTEGASGVECG